ncbi:hypothetical protein D8O27_19865 [Burkholderia mallei]|uniref:Uncharacterized protein n=2 Tax=Burkholderia mallei TaxID=13373 RepID=A0AAX1XFL2_BURML|nr:hypothetical protein BMAA2068 [Burkholderia mallei ATCC 23344]AYX33687.1 hypothetical protein EGY16_35475 [Burkholderia pseudomallei]PNW93642.1 hypothetical protein CF649_34595 [Burkholderia sp. 136(2017)]PNX12330.1 hypothetical protein CF650_25750 [Burkholderia sp. 129]PNX28824.1 hypothetical protein CF647_17450 [Burkholderia sp. 117]PNX30556.1 hypothetical protein CF648_34255 [Burkholderia sp. 137]RKN95467.1 hypothetical protein D8O31_19765 [Burkholderia mallei]
MPSIPSMGGTAISRLRPRRISAFLKSLERSQLLGLFRFHLCLASLISFAKIEAVASMISRVRIGISAASPNRGIARHVAGRNSRSPPPWREQRGIAQRPASPRPYPASRP